MKKLMAYLLAVCLCVSVPGNAVCAYDAQETAEAADEEYEMDLDSPADDSLINEDPEQETESGILQDETVEEVPEEDLEVDTEQDMDAYESVRISYTGLIESSASWTSPRTNGEMLGTVGLGKRLEAYKVNIENLADYTGTVEYRSHVQTYGWEKTWRKAGEQSGVKGKRVEAVELRLTEELQEHYDIWYRVQVETFGWLDWACNGASAGTADYAKRIEAMQILLVDKGEPAPGQEGFSFLSTRTGIRYATHVQTYGWQGARTNAQTSGTFGQSKRLEGIKIELFNCPYEGGVEYQTHIQTYGWEKEWKSNGAVSGTVGQAKRLEAIRIRLTGEIAEHCDVFYRVHAQHFGWMGWVKNGENAGTAGYAYRLEAIQIMLLPKNARTFPSAAGYIEKNKTAVSRPWNLSGIYSSASTGVEKGTEVELYNELLNASDESLVECTYQYENTDTGLKGDIGTVMAGEHLTWVPEAAGTYTITAEAKDANGVSVRKTLTLKVNHGPIGRDEAMFTAHRGLSSQAPGNTIPAFILAGQAGFDSIETDICQTKDGVFVISHDNNLKASTGVNVNISSLTYEQLSNYGKYHVIVGPNVKRYSKEDMRIPTLAEYLEICTTYNCIPQLDLKNLNSVESVGKVYEMLESYGFESSSIATSFHNLYLQSLRDLNSEIVLTYGLDTIGYVDENWLRNENVGISTNYNLLMKMDITGLLADNVLVNAYTVNDATTAGILLDKGINSITTEVVLWK